MTMQQVGNWVSENCSTIGTGPLILTGATDVATVRFNTAIANGPVYYVVKTGVNYEAGVGVLSSDQITRGPLATLTNGVYNDSSPQPILLTGASVVECTVNAKPFSDLLLHLSDTANPHQVDADQVGLGNVDNTSDADKPISDDTQAALDGKKDDFAENTAFNKNFGTSSIEVCVGDDVRLSDSRDPNPHNQDISTINGLQTALDTKMEAVIDDVAPVLGGVLQTDGHQIIVQNTSGDSRGVVSDGIDLGIAVFASYDGTYDENDGGLLAQPGGISLFGSITTIDSLSSTGTTDLQVYCNPQGTLYTVTPPDPGWSDTDTDTGVYTLATLDQWVPMTGLVVEILGDVASGGQLNITANIRVVNATSRSGSIAFGFGIDTADPILEFDYYISENYDAIIPINLSSTNHTGLTAGQTLRVFGKRTEQSHAQFNPVLDGSGTFDHTCAVSVPGEGGSGGTNDHSALINRNLENQHQIVAITGLQGALDDKEPANANIQTHIANITTNPHGITKETIGLDNADNTSDAQKPVSDATQIALDLKADINSPVFTGVPRADTATVGTNTTQLATTAFVLANSSGDHTQLSNLDTPNQHPIAVVTGLQAALDDKKDDFVEKTGFNLAIGTIAGTVAAGDDSRFAGSGGTTDHSLLVNRDIADQHPIESVGINGGEQLRDTLDSKPTLYKQPAEPTVYEIGDLFMPDGETNDIRMAFEGEQQHKLAFDGTNYATISQPVATSSDCDVLIKFNTPVSWDGVGTRYLLGSGTAGFQEGVKTYANTRFRIVLDTSVFDIDYSELPNWNDGNDHELLLKFTSGDSNLQAYFDDVFVKEGYFFEPVHPAWTTIGADGAGGNNWIGGIPAVTLWDIDDSTKSMHWSLNSGSTTEEIPDIGVITNVLNYVGVDVGDWTPFDVTAFKNLLNSTNHIYNPANTSIAATRVQFAIDELSNNFDTTNARLDTKAKAFYQADAPTDYKFGDIWVVSL